MSHMMFMTSYMIGRMRRIYFMAIPETKQDFKKSRVCYTVSDTAAQTIAQLSGGTFLATLMAYIGVSDANIGVITSLASLAALSQLFAMSYTRRLKKCKLFVCLTALQRILLAFLYFIPFLPINTSMKITLLVACYFIAQIFVQIGTPATQDWLASLVPSRLRGRYLSIKDSVAVCVVASTMLIAGVVLDYWKKSNLLVAFSILGAIIFILVVINVVGFSLMKEPKVSYLNKDGKEMHGALAKRAKKESIYDKPESLVKEFKIAFGARKFRLVFALNCLYMTSLYIANPFNASYQIKELNLPYTYIMVVGFLANILRISITPKVGKLGDKYGMARVLKYALSALGMYYLIMAFTVPGNARIMTVIGTLFSAVGWSFIGIGLFGVQLDFLSREHRMSQLTILLSISGAYGFLVSWVGGRILDVIQGLELTIGGVPIYAQQVLNIFGVCMIGVTVCFIKFVVQKEKIEVNRVDGKV